MVILINSNSLLCLKRPFQLIHRDILEEGGSAVDAAITSVLCVGVVNPQSSGLGGGITGMVVYIDGKAEALMALERAAQNASEDVLDINEKTGNEIEHRHLYANSIIMISSDYHRSGFST